MHVYAKSLQSCLALCDPMDCNPPGSPVHGILQARILEWVAMTFSRGSSWTQGPRDLTCVSCSPCIAGRFFTTEPQGKPNKEARIQRGEKSVSQYVVLEPMESYM